MSSSYSGRVGETMRKGREVAGSAIEKVRDVTRTGKGDQVLHWLTLGSIAASVALFLSGKKQLGIFVGLWPPTFQALRGRSRDFDMGENMRGRSEGMIP